MAGIKIVRNLCLVGLTVLAFLGFGSFYEDYAGQAADQYVSRLASLLQESDRTFEQYDNYWKEAKVNVDGEETGSPFGIPLIAVTKYIRAPYDYLYDGKRLVGLADFSFASDAYGLDFFNEKTVYATEYFVEDGIYCIVKAEYIKDGDNRADDVKMATTYSEEQLQHTVQQRLEITTSLKHPETAERLETLDKKYTPAKEVGGMLQLDMGRRVISQNCHVVCESVGAEVAVYIYYRTGGAKVLFLVAALLADILLLLAWKRWEDKQAKKVFEEYCAKDYNRTVLNALAHDIKSSLMVVSTSAENMLSGCEEAKRSVFEGEIASELEKLDSMIQKLDQFVRTSDLKTMETSETNVNALIDELVKRYGAAAAERELRVTVDKKGEFVLPADYELMEMVFDNFVFNAVKYATPGSEVTITLKETGFSIHNLWEPIEKYIQSPTLFFKAYDVGTTERSAKNGSGVGLAVAANVLDYYHFPYQAKADRKGVSFEVTR